jgi:hypothetical protein
MGNVLGHDGRAFVQLIKHSAKHPLLSAELIVAYL